MSVGESVRDIKNAVTLTNDHNVLSLLKYFLCFKKHGCTSCDHGTTRQITVYTTPSFKAHQRTQRWRAEKILQIQFAGDLAALCSSTQLNTKSNNTFKLQHWRHCSCFTSLQSYIQPWHSTQSKQTQRSRSPPPPAGSVMDELSDNGLGYILNLPQHHRASGCVTL